MSHPLSPKLKMVGLVAAMAMALGAAVTAAATDASTQTFDAEHRHVGPVKPTVVLVHGAWADASSFAPVTVELQKDGYKVLNAPNPLRGLETDAPNVAAFINQHTTGPVVLVGHSYGGSVITQAAIETPSVKALVYVDAYAPDTGDSVISLTGAQPGSALAAPDPSTVFDFVQYPQPNGGQDVDTYIKTTLFQQVFAAVLPTKQTDVLAASQTPIPLTALEATLKTEPAWKTIKSYFFIGTRDKVIPQAEQFAMAYRANGIITTGEADHLSMLETPHQITSVIEQASE